MRKAPKNHRTRINFAGLEFLTPLVAVSGTAGYLHDFSTFTNITAFGGMAFKSITPQLRAGSPPSRICECEAGFINSVGLQNDGIEIFKTEHYPRAKKLPLQKIANLAAFSLADFTDLVKTVATLSEIGIIELNISCPNVDYAGKHFASDLGLLKELLQATVAVKGTKRLMVKLSPHVSSISEVARLCETHGADALSLVNTFRGMKIDITTRRPMIRKVVGGYSGLGIKPIALAMVYEAAQATSIPILGLGGVSSYEDVIEYMLAGASLVGVGTASLMDPRTIPRIFKHLVRYLDQHDIQATDLIGAMKQE